MQGRASNQVADRAGSEADLDWAGRLGGQALEPGFGV